MTNDLISREALKKAFCCKFPSITPNEMYLCGRALDLIDNAPTVDVGGLPKIHYDRGFIAGYGKAIEERPQGEWIKIGEIGLAYKCNKCGENNVIPTNFCPNCGADMRGKEE